MLFLNGPGGVNDSDLNLGVSSSFDAHLEGHLRRNQNPEYLKSG